MDFGFLSSPSIFSCTVMDELDIIDPLPLYTSSTPLILQHCICGSKIHAYSVYATVSGNFDLEILTESLRRYRSLPYPLTWYVYRGVAAVVNKLELQAFDQIHYSTTSDHQPQDHVAISQEDLDRYASHGLTKKQIYTFIRMHKYHKEEESEVCTVCHAEFEKDRIISELQCKHRFHMECIRELLLRKNVCPVCKRPALNV
ncbi:hypothetical protein OSB04_005510 [Centaurea solstitialis]|uniref:RING-type E3 ubiquitin transferase n=1 Tax=Centaurea solstitialis TaxID=347529 RepID=A0AA38TSU3_9ASTR|nr:hypothetical protein OSB04_005510 [Centaurea solstitialis]